MKKFLPFGLGFLLFGLAIVPFSQASRDAYHAYLYQKHLKYAPQTNGELYRAPRRERKGKGVNQTRNLRYSQSNTRNAFGLRYYQNEFFPRRYSTLRLQPWQLTPLVGREYYFTKLNNRIQRFRRFVNESFSIDVPSSFVPHQIDDGYAFTSPRSPYVVSVQSAGKCNNETFLTCAIALSTNANHRNPAEKILTSTRIKRLSHFSHTTDEPAVQTPTVMEGFGGYIAGEEYFISRFFVPNKDGEVLMVETRIPFHQGNRYIGVSKHIFDSFQLFVREQR